MDLHFIRCGVPHCSILGRLLFLFYINELHYPIKHCKFHHFADDTSLLNFGYFIKKMNKQVNYDLLNATKICCNVDKTEIVLFKVLTKQTDSELHLKLTGKRQIPTDSLKYLGIITDKNLSWHHQINNIAAKLKRANVMLSKISYFVNFNTLKSIHHAILESHLNYLLTVWAQNGNSIKRLLVLHKKSLRIF